MIIGCWEVPKPTDPSFLWPAEWKVPAPLTSYFSTFTFHVLDVVYLCYEKFLILCGDWCAPAMVVCLCIVQISTNYVLQHSRLTHINPAMHSDAFLWKSQEKYQSPYIVWHPQATAVKPGIYGLAFEIGEMFFTDNLEMVGQVSMIFSADPHKILILIKWWKNQPSSTSASACA